MRMGNAATTWYKEEAAILKAPNRREDVFGALRLAYEITSDLWWQRAWTFQENYKTERKMCLVINHHKDLEQEKRDYGSFGEIPGELCIKSRDFSIYVTKLCLAIEQTGKALKGDLEMIKYIKATAGHYDLLQEMSGIALPHILKNVEKRSLSKIWDRLDIIANCLEFSVRVATPKKPKNEAGYSMSISMLAMCLLNGQILNNKEQGHASAEDLTVSQFLKDYSLDNFYPTNATAYLARNNGCRLVDTELTENGILATGHLWQLGEIVYTGNFNNDLPYVGTTNSFLNLKDRQRLTKLCNLPQLASHPRLIRYIQSLLEQDSAGHQGLTTFTGQHLLSMAREISSAVEKGNNLRLARRWGASPVRDQATALFIWPGGASFERRYKNDFAFTSSRPQKYPDNDIPYFATLEVEVEATVFHNGSSIPSLLQSNSPNVEVKETP
ncbi:hypothetical protein S7711_09456 [Stachybotrys chartarum IBT 7711]|uniref:Heterokaryon incompatibility domain-containing protein n=1 Tax=Stachybotrys chartarum (strain CBS 109288 / IBT 7711) TaxID=1280523 RepID=A0A084B8T1_STACB|nr:hypothetical protein S7711_09456 [Stachybotrys chartarum IBT 7711]